MPKLKPELRHVEFSDEEVAADVEEAREAIYQEKQQFQKLSGPTTDEEARQEIAKMFAPKNDHYPEVFAELTDLGWEPAAATSVARRTVEILSSDESITRPQARAQAANEYYRQGEPQATMMIPLADQLTPAEEEERLGSVAEVAVALADIERRIAKIRQLLAIENGAGKRIRKQKGGE